METKTKYNINDNVWFMNNLPHLPMQGKIVNIFVEINGKEEKKPGDKKDIIKTGNFVQSYLKIEYDLYAKTYPDYKRVSQTKLYDSKEELINIMIERLKSL